MRLNQLADRPGAKRASRRLGRGIGSGKGKTSGHGHKGAKARSGVAIDGFEGGQMPIYRRLPKRGFHNIFRKVPEIVNLGRLQVAIDAGKIDASKSITIDSLRAAGLIDRAKDGVRLLAKGDLTTKIDIEVWGASKAAVEAVEKAGGKIVLLAPPAPDKEAKRARRAKGKGDKGKGDKGKSEAASESSEQPAATGQAESNAGSGDEQKEPKG